MNIHLSLRWFYNTPGQSGEMSEELFALLKAIDESGSLRAAARQCQLSYRHCWGLLQKWQQRIGQPLVLLERGRGAVLTRPGQILLWAEQRIAARLEPELASLASETSAQLQRTLDDSRSDNNLRIFASHGLAIALLREMAGAAPNLDMQFHGSLDSLRLWKKGRCDLAGFHLPEGELGRALLPRLRRYLNPETDVLIYAVRRRQGLITAAGNPFTIKNLADLIEKPVRFINRQQNSGTRTTFDLFLQKAQIDAQKIQGYHNEEFTHLAVAALIASNAADCGFGIEEAARQFHLHFIPFNWESYWFALHKDRLHTAPLADFLSLLRSHEFAQRVAELSGYESARAGNLVRLDQELETLLV